MSFLKRAIISIKRRPGKSIILLLLVFILGNIISGAISVEQAIQNTEFNLKQSLPAVAKIEEDWDELYRQQEATGEWVFPDRIDSELIERIGQLPYVADFDYSIADELFSKELKRVTHPDPQFDHAGWSLAKDVEGLESLKVKGVHNPEVFDIIGGAIELIAGRPFTEEEINNFDRVRSVALVSKSFAELNNLTVGSTFTLDNTAYDMFNSQGEWNASEIFKDDNILAEESYEIEVIGIFEPINAPNTGNKLDDADQEMQLANRIYVPNAVAEAGTMLKFEQAEASGANNESDLNLDNWIKYESIFLLNDPQDLDTFAEEAQNMLPENWQVSDLSNNFADIASSMETLQWLSSLILWIAVGAALLILSLLITLFLRDRKYEIGIYLALGEKKIKVISQIILEVVATGFVAITLSLFTGSLLAGNISETMLRQDLINQQEDNSMGGGLLVSEGSGDLNMFSPGELTPEEMLENYALSIDATTVILFYSIGIGTILVSTVAPILYITRLNPKKVMM